MTRQNLFVTSILGGVVAALIIAAAGFFIRGWLSRHDIVGALLVGAGSGLGLFFAFMGRLEKSGRKKA